MSPMSVASSAYLAPSVSTLITVHIWTALVFLNRGLALRALMNTKLVNLVLVELFLRFSTGLGDMPRYLTLWTKVS